MKRFFYVLLASLIISTSVPSFASASTTTTLLSSAKSLLKTPYRHGGTTSSGIDCSAYTQVVFKKEGISIPRSTVDQYKIGTPVAKNALQTGDLVFFNTNGRSVSHVGIYIGANQFIHASTSKGVMISSINDPYYWGSRYIGARRVANFTTETTNVSKASELISLPTRSDIAEILTKELGLQIPSTSNIKFSDVSSNHPQINAIHAVAEANIFSGSNGAFLPNDHLTRAQLAKVLVEAFNLHGTTDVNFNDVSDSNWASPYIKTLYALDITKGYANGNFGVNDKVTEIQFLTFIERIKELN